MLVNVKTSFSIILFNENKLRLTMHIRDALDQTAYNHKDQSILPKTTWSPPCGNGCQGIQQTSSPYNWRKWHHK